MAIGMVDAVTYELGLCGHAGVTKKKSKALSIHPPPRGSSSLHLEFRLYHTASGLVESLRPSLFSSI